MRFELQIKDEYAQKAWPQFYSGFFQETAAGIVHGLRQVMFYNPAYK